MQKDKRQDNMGRRRSDKALKESLDEYAENEHILDDQFDKDNEELRKECPNGGHCNEHYINKYRLNLVEKSTDTLCETAKTLSESQIKNTTFIRIAGTIVTVTVIGMFTVSSSGWWKMSQFTDAMYKAREKDHAIFEKYRRDAQKIHTNHENIITQIAKDLAIQSDINIKQNEAIDKLRYDLIDHDPRERNEQTDEEYQ